MSKYSSIKVHLFKNSKESFLQALDEENIPHSSREMFSHGTIINAGAVETITAISEAMPWNALAKVINKWIEARESRVIQITLKTGDDMQVFHARGYSIKEIERILPSAINMTVIQKKEDEKT